MHWDSISDLATLGMWADPGSYAYADDQHEIDPEVARRVCGLWLEALGRTRSRKSEHAFSQPRLVQEHPTHPPSEGGAAAAASTPQHARICHSAIVSIPVASRQDTLAAGVRTPNT